MNEVHQITMGSLFDGSGFDGKKLILDCTCGNRGMWFNKHHPRAVYTDKRTEWTT